MNRLPEAARKTFRLRTSMIIVDARKGIPDRAAIDLTLLTPASSARLPADHHPYDAEVTNPGSTQIILARHGEAAYSSDNGGDASGGILTELGRSQARALGNQLRTREVVAIVCSDLSRARQTAEIAAEILHLPVDIRAGLHE